jgi:hypothetical protein
MQTNECVCWNFYTMRIFLDVFFFRNAHRIMLVLKLGICTWRIVLTAAVRVSCQENAVRMTGLNWTDGIEMYMLMSPWYSTFNWRAWKKEKLVRYRRGWGHTFKKILQEIRKRVWIDLIRLSKWHRNFALCKGRGILWLTVGNYFLNNESLEWSKIRHSFFCEDYCRLGYDVLYSGMFLAKIHRKPLPPSSGWNNNFHYCYFNM